MKQRMRKKPLYRRLRKARLAELLLLMKKIAATLGWPPVNPDEYHKAVGDLPTAWPIGHAHAVNR